MTFRVPPVSTPGSEHMRPFGRVIVQLGLGDEVTLQVHLVAPLVHVPLPLQFLFCESGGGHLSKSAQASCCSLMYAFMAATTDFLMIGSGMKSVIGAYSHSSGTVWPGTSDAFHASTAALLTLQPSEPSQSVGLPPQVLMVQDVRACLGQGIHGSPVSQHNNNIGPSVIRSSQLTPNSFYSINSHVGRVNRNRVPTHSVEANIEIVFDAIG